MPSERARVRKDCTSNTFFIAIVLPFHRLNPEFHFSSLQFSRWISLINHLNHSMCSGFSFSQNLPQSLADFLFFLYFAPIQRNRAVELTLTWHDQFFSERFVVRLIFLFVRCRYLIKRFTDEFNDVQADPRKQKLLWIYQYSVINFQHQFRRAQYKIKIDTETSQSLHDTYVYTNRAIISSAAFDLYFSFILPRSALSRTKKNRIITLANRMSSSDSSECSACGGNEMGTQKKARAAVSTGFWIGRVSSQTETKTQWRNK